MLNTVAPLVNQVPEIMPNLIENILENGELVLNRNFGNGWYEGEIFYDDFRAHLILMETEFEWKTTTQSLNFQSC